MRDFQRKRKIRRILYSKGVLLALLVLLVLIGKAAWSVYEKERESRNNLVRVENELATLKARETKLETDIGRLRTDEGVEAAIREQFQVAKPGERMVVLVKDRKNTEESVLEEKSLVAKFFDLFR